MASDIGCSGGGGGSTGPVTPTPTVCSHTSTTAAPASAGTAMAYLNAISDSQWATAETNLITLTMNSDAVPNYSYTWTDSSGNILTTPEFTAGQPYVLKMINKAGSGSTPNDALDHYFYAPNFFKAIAVKQIKTGDAIYKVPRILDFELNRPARNLNAGGTVQDSYAMIYFVPIITGTYHAKCTVTGHAGAHAETGMQSDLIITGTTAPLSFNIDTDFSSVASSRTEDPRRDGADIVWTGLTPTNISLVETAGVVGLETNPTLSTGKASIFYLSRPLWPL